MKRTIKEWWKCLVGEKYLANHSSKEIHRLTNKHANCHTSAMLNKEYVTEAEANELLLSGYDGCRWCWVEQNNG